MAPLPTPWIRSCNYFLKNCTTTEKHSNLFIVVVSVGFCFCLCFIKISRRKRWGGSIIFQMPKVTSVFRLLLFSWWEFQIEFVQCVRIGVREFFVFPYLLTSAILLPATGFLWRLQFLHFLWLFLFSRKCEIHTFHAICLFSLIKTSRIHFEPIFCLSIKFFFCLACKCKSTMRTHKWVLLCGFACDSFAVS